MISRLHINWARQFECGRNVPEGATLSRMAVDSELSFVISSTTKERREIYQKNNLLLNQYEAELMQDSE